MPLFDSLSAGAARSHRLSKMSTIPTTEDLRYALEEAKKKKLPCDLPFENPNTRCSFIIRVVPAAPPAVHNWIFLFGDGPRATVIWTRLSTEVMMIHSKMKIDSARTQFGPTGPQYSYGQEEPQEQQQEYVEEPPPPEPVQNKAFGGLAAAHLDALQNAAPQYGGSQPGAPQNLRATGGFPAQPAIPFAGAQNDNGNPFAGLNAPDPSSFTRKPAPPEAAPNAVLDQSDTAQLAAAARAMEDAQFANIEICPDDLSVEEFESIDAAPIMASHIVPGVPMASAPSASAWAPSAAKPAAIPAPAAPIPVSNAGVIMQPAQAAPGPGARWQAAMAPPQAKTPLPEPFPLDWTIAQDVEQSLCDPQSGLASINTFVFFLYREVKRFEKDHSPAVVVSFELRLQYPDGRFVPLPAEALPILSKQLRSVLSPIDVMTHVSNGEFAVVLPGSDRSTAEQFCNRLFVAMTETPLLANVKQIVCNIGAAAIPETSTDPEIVIAAARQASEMARQNNAPYFFFT